MLSSAEFEPIAVSLYDAFDRAEHEFAGPVHHWDTISQRHFRTWLWDNYGISVHRDKFKLAEDATGFERYVWGLVGWKDDELLIMFKLQYG